MTQAHRRDDLSDKSWALLEPHLSRQAGQWGGVAHDNRRFLNAVFWILRTGAPWCDLALDYGDCENTPSALLPLARQGRLGEPAGKADQ